MLAPGVDGRRPVDDEEALRADVALVHEDGTGLRVDGLTDLGDPEDVALVDVGEDRKPAEAVEDRLVDLV